LSPPFASACATLKERGLEGYDISCGPNDLTVTPSVATAR
jgi:hypothetical protein